MTAFAMSALLGLRHGRAVLPLIIAFCGSFITFQVRTTNHPRCSRNYIITIYDHNWSTCFVPRSLVAFSYSPAHCLNFVYRSLQNAVKCKTKTITHKNSGLRAYRSLFSTEQSTRTATMLTTPDSLPYASCKNVLNNTGSPGKIRLNYLYHSSQ